MKISRYGYCALTFSISLLGCGDKGEVGSSGSVYYQAYEIEPSFLAPEELDHERPSELFPSKNQTIHEFLDEIGIEFTAPTSVVITGLDHPGFGMKNTEENHAVLVRSLDERFPGRWTYADTERSNQTGP